MPADWRDTVLPLASFRGVNFHTADIREAFGRAVAVHNYPQGQWFPEDVGEDPHTHSVTGFVLGDDYLDQRKALVQAFKASGPGTLVHPWLGTMTVQCGKVGASLSASRGGSWEFSLEVIEVVEERGPVVAVDGPLLLVNAVAAVETSALADFIADVNSQGFPSFVNLGSVAEYSRLSVAFSATASRFIASVSEDISDILDAVALINPTEAPATLGPLTVDLLRLFEPLPIWRAFLAGITPRVPVALVASPTPSEQRLATNQDATNAFFVQLSLAYAVRAVSLAEFDSFDDALLLRDELVGRVNAELELTEGDAAFTALLDLRTQLTADIDSRSTDLAVLRTVELDAPKASLELAWERYSDPIREAEIVERNDVMHPAFMIGSIRVLSE